MRYKLQPHLFPKQKPRVGETKKNKQWFLLTQTNTVKSLKIPSQGGAREAVQPHLNVSYNSAIALHKNKVMFCGGCSYQDDIKNAKCSIISFDGNIWKEEGNLMFPRYDATAVSVKGALYIFGGLSSFDLIENRTERFLNGNCETIFFGLARSRSLACAVVVKDLVFLIGGSFPQQPIEKILNFRCNQLLKQTCGNPETASSSVDCINISSKQLRQFAPLNEGRASFAATVIESTIYVFGGFSNNGDSLSSTEFLDTKDENPTWTFLTNAPVLLPMASSCLISDDEIIVLGGDSDQLFCYDTTSGTWKTSVKTEQEKLGNDVAGAKIFGLGM
uniref:Kelch-like protein 12 n=1 Tax=Phallusia mammillata TaxID=59560 RepID=A0A6F9DG04_9ASCI|nr:kelch-like protein 12 [Phallusia mammillata]